MRALKQRTHRTNVTVHRRALGDANLRRAVAELRRSWNRIGRVERGDRLRELANIGCSTRGLAEELRVSATTVRRHMEIAALPEPERAAVSTGASAKWTLAKQAEAKQKRRIAERMLVEKQTGKLSSLLADVVIAFCRGEYLREVRVPRLQLSEFLFSVAQHLRRLSFCGTRRLRLSKKLPIRQMLKRVRPTGTPDILQMEHHAEWLARLIWSLEPEPLISEKSLRKAEQRSKELEKQGQVKTPLQLYRERVQRLASVSAAPPRRRY